jgi:hypothetical protein
MSVKPMQGKGRFPMSAVRKRPPVTRKTGQEINKKAIYWVAGSFTALVVIISALIIVNG